MKIYMCTVYLKHVINNSYGGYTVVYVLPIIVVQPYVVHELKILFTTGGYVCTLHSFL